MTFGERARYEREKKGWTFKQMGVKVGVSFATVSKYERGILKPNPYKVQQFATALGVTPAYLTLGDETPAPVIEKKDGEVKIFDQYKAPARDVKAELEESKKLLDEAEAKLDEAKAIRQEAEAMQNRRASEVILDLAYTQMQGLTKERWQATFKQYMKMYDFACGVEGGTR